MFLSGPGSLQGVLTGKVVSGREERLSLASSLLDWFIQLNWTGPREGVSHYISNEEQVRRYRIYVELFNTKIK